MARPPPGLEVPGQRLVFTWTWRQTATGQTGEETVITAEFQDLCGETQVRLTHAGLWLVRTEAKAVPADGSADQEVLRSTLTFFVK